MSKRKYKTITLKTTQTNRPYPDRPPYASVSQ